MSRAWRAFLAGDLETAIAETQWGTGDHRRLCAIVSSIARTHGDHFQAWMDVPQSVFGGKSAREALSFDDPDGWQTLHHALSLEPGRNFRQHFEALLGAKRQKSLPLSDAPVKAGGVVAARDLSESVRQGTEWHAIYDLDLLAAAWQWPIGAIESVTACSAKSLDAMRHHRFPVDSDLIDIVQQLKSLHYWLWMKPGPASFAEWWRLAVMLPEPWGERVPLDLVREQGAKAIRPLSAHLESWVFL
jgi:hypothetical protein